MCNYLEPGDAIIDGGNEWYENTERRESLLKEKGVYMGMGVSGGEEEFRNGPSLMPGGSEDAHKIIEDVVIEIAAKEDDGACVIYWTGWFG